MFVVFKFLTFEEIPWQILEQKQCPDIWIEPPFFPVGLNDFRARTNTPDESRIEISTCGLQSASRRIFYVGPGPCCTKVIKWVLIQNLRKKRGRYICSCVH